MLYYLGILFFLGPWVLLAAGGILRVLRGNRRLVRFQAEGAVLILLSSVATWLVFDQNIGPGYEGGTSWAYWFARGEIGLFWIGLLMFVLGFFLERNRGPGFQPWPTTGKRVCMAFILIGLVLALLSLRRTESAWADMPWSNARLFFSAGSYPFAIGYVLFRKLRGASLSED